MLRQEKADAVAEIKQLFEQSEAYFITDYQGLNVADLTKLRKDLRDNNIRFLVSKNTLFKLAAKESGQQDLDEHFNGPTAVVFAQSDPSVAAKILHESNKEKELPRFKAFVVENQIHGADQVKRLAELPSRDVLLSMLVSAIEAPMAELVGTLDGFFRELVGTIDALAEQKKDAA